MWLIPLVIRVARPWARGLQRRIWESGALSANAVFTNSASRSTSLFRSRALAMALSISFATTGLAALRVKRKRLSASAAFFPRTRSTIARAFRGDILVNLAFATASTSFSRSRRRCSISVKRVRCLARHNGLLKRRSPPLGQTPSPCVSQTISSRFGDYLS